VLNFADRLGGVNDVALTRQLAGEVMGYHPAEHVPTFDFLADNYALCDRWFAAHPGHTWPNRFVSLTGRLATGPDGLPQVDNPHSDTFDPLETETIVDHLLAAGVSCRYFEHDFCMLRVFSRYTFDDTVIAPIDDPGRGFFALAGAGNLPAVSFVEPDLTGIDVGNDDHPPADVTAGQLFLRRVYDALADGPRAQWNGTLLLITYDEHGGFYDHVHPEEQQVLDTADPLRGGFVPIALDPETLEPVTHYGMRVPALVVSPWVPPRSVSSLVFDHTSILKTIIARFLAANPPDLGWRVALAEHVGPLLSRAMLRDPVHPPGDPPLAPPRVLLRRRGRPTFIGPAEPDFRDFLRGFRDRVRS
jgi:phospholipase C